MKTLTSKQKVFDYIIKHLRKQNAKSLLPRDLTKDTFGPSCAYKGMGDMKCAVGCLIEDEEYTDEIERVSIDTLLSEYDLTMNSPDMRSRIIALRKIFNPKFSKLNKDRKTKMINMLVALQNVHDRYLTSSSHNIRIKLENIANTYNVKYVPSKKLGW